MVELLDNDVEMILHPLCSYCKFEPYFFSDINDDVEIGFCDKIKCEVVNLKNKHTARCMYSMEKGYFESIDM